ncbi:MAG TPA: VOC family protein [Bauldia sp.]|nr:VOC family protein [Bauldia sp.]
MAAKGVGFVGMRTDRLAETIDLFENVLGLPLTRHTGDFAVFTLPDGALVELFGPQTRLHSVFTTGPVVGFRVDDFDATNQALVDAAVAFVSEVQHADGVSWRHFRCPDGTIVEITGPGKAPEA